MITADSSMYRSKRAGKNRVTGVPVVGTTEIDADEIAPLAPPPSAPPVKPTNGPASAVVSSGRARGRADKSV
jgi:hypothetical protein